MRSIKLVLTAFLVGVLAFSLNAQSVQQDTPQFTQIAKTEQFLLLVNPASKHQTEDEDGDTLSGGVFRIVPVKPIAAEGMVVFSLEYSVIGVCGHNGILVARMQLFGSDGALLKSIDELKAVQLTNPDAPLSLIYQYLCTGKSNKQDKRNGSKWI